MRLLVVVLAAWCGLAVLTAVAWTIAVRLTRASATRRALEVLNAPASAPAAARSARAAKGRPAVRHASPPT
jgi:guanyl-specific ribonuclease Sa